MKSWTVEQLLSQVADILVRLENDKADDAMELAGRIVGDTEYHARAYQEYVEEFGDEEADGEDVNGPISWQDWLELFYPIRDNLGDPKVFTIKDLTEQYPHVPIANFWYEIRNVQGDLCLVTGTHYSVDKYYVTEYPGKVSDIVLVQEADDEIDQLNRDQLPWFKENMK